MTTETTETESLPRRHYMGLDPSINEPFVKPEVVGDFLDLNDATVVRFANAGFLPGYPLRESGKEDTLALPTFGNQAEHPGEKADKAGPWRPAARTKQID